MAQLKMLVNFRVKALFNNQNVTNVGKFMFDPSLIASNSCAPPPLHGSFKGPIIISSNSMSANGAGSFETPINLESDSTQTNTDVKPLAKKQHKNYDATRKWENNCVSICLDII